MLLLLLLKYIGHKKKVANGSVYTRPFTVTAPVSAMHLPRKLVIGFQTLFHPIILPLLSKFSLPGIISQASSNNPYSPFENPFLKLFLSGSEASSRGFRNPLPLYTSNSTEMVVSPHWRWAIQLCMFGAQQQRLAYGKCLKQFTQMHCIVRAGNIIPKVTFHILGTLEPRPENTGGNLSVPRLCFLDQLPPWGSTEKSWDWLSGSKSQNAREDSDWSLNQLTVAWETE